VHGYNETETLCVRCHFEMEEAIVLPYLKWWERWQLLWAHARLCERDYPPREMLAHAEWEMPMFRRRCPPDVVAELEAQHARLVPMLRAKLAA
jgi:hypothetical protein